MRLDQLRMDWKVVTAVVVSTLTMVVDQYHHIFTHKAYDRMLLFLGVPLLVILLIFRESPADYGFRLGDWKAGLVLTAAGCGMMALIMSFVARSSEFQSYYGHRAQSGIPVPLDTALDLFGWEFLLRGFLLFALYPVCGPYAILLQAVPFTIAHYGKPELETLSCIFGGSAFGYVAWRTRSFLYPFLIHWFMATLTVLIASGALG
ncbi:MAG: CPBP family intramembrane glutamic endopeptidase [Chloroflexota bacterium]|nr:CPBP family intramembrane glutamic endopeptidase [Chloroflexota bacterium]